MPDPVTPNLGLTLPVVHEQDWGVPTLNANFSLIDAFAGSVILKTPTATQTIAQPGGTYFNVNFPVVYNFANPAMRFGTAASLWDSALTRTGAGAFTLDSNVPANAAATLKLNVLNAVAGLQVNSAAPLNHILIGDGTHYVDSATLPAGLVFYQTVQANGTSRTQQPRLNFLPRFTAANNGGNTSTDVDLGTTAVTPGSYTNPNLTIDAYGRVTAAADGGGITATVTDVSGSRTTSTIYHNTGLNPLYVSGNANSNTGTSTCHIAFLIGPSSPPTMAVYQCEFGATVSNGSIGFSGVVPAGWFYELIPAGDVGWGASSRWFETTLS